MKAVIIQKQGEVVVIDRDEPQMRPDYIKVKTVAVGINPTDTVAVYMDPKIGHMLGVDFSGIIEEIGESFRHTPLKPGDAVYGVCFSNNRPDDGSFAEKILVKDGHLAKIPDALAFEEAATLGTNIATIGQAFYLHLQIPLPGEITSKARSILVHGAGTSTGTLAVQMAKQSGLRVIATCSPRSSEHVRSCGADHIFDYSNPNCGAEIRELTKDGLHTALNCVGSVDSVRICEAALSTNCNNWLPNLVSMYPIESVRNGVSAQAMLAYTTFGEEFERFGQYFPPIRSHFEHGVKMWRMIPQLIAEGKVKPHPHVVRQDGLEGIAEGLRDVWEKSHGSARLVYKVSDVREQGLS